MAMNPKLSEGSILLYYPDIQEKHTWRSYREPSQIIGYDLTIHALYVYSRRARTNGARVPVALQPYLDALKVKTSRYRDDKYMTAVGCSTRTIYHERVGVNVDISQAFREAFKNVKELTGNIPDLVNNDFVEQFLATKMKNKDKKMVLFPPKERLQGFYTVKELHELEDNDIWAESRRYKLPR